MSEHDYDLDEINSAFSELRSASLPHVAPPGMTAARTTIRKRRQRRVVLLGIVGVLAVLIPVTSFARSGGDHVQPPPMTETPTPGPSPSVLIPSPSPTPVTTGSPATTIRPGTGGNRPAKASYTATWIVPRLDGVTLDLPKSKAVTIPIGVKVTEAPVTNVTLTVNLAQILSKVEVVSVGSPCLRSGSTLTCDYGNLKVGEYRANLTLRAKAGASGSAGKVTAKVTGTENSWHIKETWGTVSVSGNEDMADMRYSTNSATIRLGQTGVQTLTARNYGPSAQTAYTLQGSVEAGLQFAGVSGPGCTHTATSFSCDISGIPSGSAVTIKLTIKVAKCDPNQRWNSRVLIGRMGGLADPVFSNNDIGLQSVRVTGC